MSYCIVRIPLEKIWVKYIFQYIWEGYHVPKKLLAQYVNPKLLNEVYEIQYGYHRCNKPSIGEVYFKKIGKKALLDFIKKEVDLTTNPIEYTGTLKDYFNLDDMMIGDLEFYADYCVIGTYIYGIVAGDKPDNKDMELLACQEDYDYCNYPGLTTEEIEDLEEKQLDLLYQKVKESAEKNVIV